MVTRRYVRIGIYMSVNVNKALYIAVTHHGVKTYGAFLINP